MNTNVATTGEFNRILHFVIQELKPRGPWLTTFNVISIPGDPGRAGYFDVSVLFTAWVR